MFIKKCVSILDLTIDIYNLIKNSDTLFVSAGEKDWEFLTEEKQQSYLIIVEKLLRKKMFSPDIFHNNWKIEMEKNDWVLGNFSYELKRHPYLISYSKLDRNYKSVLENLFKLLRSAKSL